MRMIHMMYHDSDAAPVRAGARSPTPLPGRRAGPGRGPRGSGGLPATPRRAARRRAARARRRAAPHREDLPGPGGAPPPAPARPAHRLRRLSRRDGPPRPRRAPRRRGPAEPHRCRAHVRAGQGDRGGDAGGHRFGIDPADWLEYLRAKFAEKKLAIDESSVDRLLDATGGHPQDTMQVCAALYYLMRDTGARTVTADLLGVAYEQAMRELERPFALHWGELGTHKYLQQVTKRIAHGAVLYAAEGDGATVPRPEVLRALRALEERGLVVRLGRGRYDFVEPMFGEYVRRLDEAVLVAAIVPKR